MRRVARSLGLAPGRRGRPSVGQVEQAVASLQARAVLADRLADGVPAERALLDAVTALLEADEPAPARRLAEGAAALGTRAQQLARLVLAHHDQAWALAVEAMAGLADEDVARWAAVPAVEACLAGGHHVERARRVAACASLMPTADVVGVAARFLALADRETAESLAQVARGRDEGCDEGWDARTRRRMEVLERWLARPREPDAPPGAVRLGIIDYHSVDDARSSFNVGDYVQTLAVLGHVARYVGCSLSGDEELVDVVRELQPRVRPDLRVDDVAGALHLVPVSRDSSTLEAHDEPVWLLAFGWHMHPLFGLRHDFPYHPALRPIFVSFYVHDPRMLTPQALDHLRRHGPVGCRDWSTVDLLLGAGVDAFFTGCLTTTLDGVFPERPEVTPDAPVALVDVPRGSVPVPGATEHVRHMRLEYRRATVGEGVRAASDLLRRYQERHSSLVTSRLHAYLPATTLGVPVRFRPRDPSDPRFDGLLGLDPAGERLHAMRDDIRELVGEVLGLVVTGADEDVVRARWCELTRPRVAEARARLAAAGLPAAAHEGLAETVAQVRERAVQCGPPEEAVDEGTTDVVTGVDAESFDRLPVALEAMTRAASGHLRVWVTTRGLGESGGAAQARVAAAFPDVALTFLPCDRLELPGVARRGGPGVLDPLLVAELLPDVARAVHLDVDVLCLGDVAELARTELSGHPFAARPAPDLAARLWREAWREAEVRLPSRRGHTFRRAMAARHPFDVRAVEPGVLVLDLDRLRVDRVAERWLPVATTYALTGTETLLAYAGADRADLDARWLARAGCEPVGEPLAVRYGGAAAPWEGPAAGDGWWHEHAERARRRTEAV